MPKEYLKMLEKSPASLSCGWSLDSLCCNKHIKVLRSNAMTFMVTLVAGAPPQVVHLLQSLGWCATDPGYSQEAIESDVLSGLALLSLYSRSPKGFRD